MWRGIACALALGACERPAPSIAPPEPAPTLPVPAPSVVAIDAGVAATTLDALIDWIVAHDVESLSATHDDGVLEVGLTSAEGGVVCRADACYALAAIAAVDYLYAPTLIVRNASDPSVAITGELTFDDESATFVARSSAPVARPLGARPPAPTRAAHGRTTLSPVASSAIDGLAAAIERLDETTRFRATTLRATGRRITLISADEGDDGSTVVLVRDGSTSARAREVQGIVASPIEVVGQRLGGDFVVLRVTIGADRGWSSELWSVSSTGPIAYVESVSVGGADGYGEACEDESDGYCVWLTGCERELVVDDATHAHLGPPQAWAAEHRRLSDRWIDSVPTDVTCPPATIDVTERGLVEHRLRPDGDGAGASR